MGGGTGSVGGAGAAILGTGGILTEYSGKLSSSVDNLITS